jgi:hypothetical protein
VTLPYAIGLLMALPWATDLLLVTSTWASVGAGAETPYSAFCCYPENSPSSALKQQKISRPRQSHQKTNRIR